MLTQWRRSGDSYTDVVNTGDGGVAWPVYAARDGNLSLHPFAKSGGTCSNNITFRPSPSVMESQVPAFINASKSGSMRLPSSDTVYTLWIGTNDVGQSALLTGNDPGFSIVDVTACAIDWVRIMHNLGARNFIFQNMIPLQLTQLYSADSFPNRFWHFERNTTEWAVFMTELTTAGNAISKLMLQALAPSLRDSRIALFDSHALFTDMFIHPELYLNGTAPLNVTGSINECVFELNGGPVGGACPNATTDGAVRDSFLWFDELHPSEQADRIVAREMVKAMKGNTRFATWIS
ncbi:carbohydrate esterase family 16 protein [Exidia glandulosa HHB12029]|uniref:Carbohydrate esterase family 16 protein n=1 Tax=Exidia glandulosa HHB12029 TaxID=1314781 RepID=A0A165F0Y1_EXIGL|nr:carbohydrate esterase family 16 protein [Exidia glandulosa HHB12029]